EVAEQTEQWVELYNIERPHDSLNDMTPIQYKMSA
ncbi:transposase, partial [Cardiobacteriaceae bacterium TAE3-ERU3]|nr:transposase [Cardiobacteriaceae bacterium TAE3-ERU3]MBV7435634.1 transposase [Cardiobacteriaceae bacterium TAE3-ERU3]